MQNFSDIQNVQSRLSFMRNKDAQKVDSTKLGGNLVKFGQI